LFDGEHLRSASVSRLEHPTVSADLIAEFFFSFSGPKRADKRLLKIAGAFITAKAVNLF